MIKTLVDLVLRVTDLAEAEGRAAKANTIRVIVLAAVMLGCAVVGAAGLLGLAAALVLALADVMPIPAAIAIVSAAALLASTLIAMMMVRRTRRPEP